MSGNGVKITEVPGGSLVVQREGFPAIDIWAAEVAALRAYFAAERMPEDVQALLAKAQKFVELRGFTQATNLVDELALALEAAYSQKAEARVLLTHPHDGHANNETCLDCDKGVE